MFSKFAVVVSLVALTGCSTVIKGTSDNVSVNSMEKGSTIYIDGAARGTDSAMVSLKKGKPHNIRVEKEGCQPITAETAEAFDATSLLGILLDFGIVTIPVDLISGAAWKIEPTSYTVTPICKK